MHEVVGYELMSANDAPERDPMDWYDIYEHGCLYSLGYGFSLQAHQDFFD